MKTTVKMPRVADSADTVTVVEWDRAVGDEVRAGDILLRVETDKAIVELPSPVSGVITKILVAVDSDVSTGTPIAVLETV